MRYYETTGANTKEAIQIALEETQMKMEDVKVEILETGDNRGKARVRIYLHAPELDLIENFLLKIVEFVGDRGRCTFSFRAPKIYVNLNTRKSNKLFIGHRGRTLDALECLLYQIFRKNFKDFKVYLDVGDYRKRKKDFLVHKAKAISRVVKETKREMAIDPLSEDEVKIVKNSLKSDKSIRFYTVQKGGKTNLIIAPK